MGLLNPVMLACGLSIAALVLIYLRSHARPTIEVSSLALFEESTAPVARSRVLRVDALFWLQAAALAGLTLVAAGLYLRVHGVATERVHRALIFDLGASMGAADGNATRLGAAERRARKLVNEAASAVQFSLITYALEARMVSAETGDRRSLEIAIGSLGAQDIATRAAALRSALNIAGGAQQIDLFTDHPPAADIVNESAAQGRLRVHLLGHPADNVAILDLNPGVPKSTEGRCVLRSFAQTPRNQELIIDLDGREVFHSPLILEPRSRAAVRFGPLPHGGIVHARITPADGLAADNQRYALAPTVRPAKALVVSPDGAVRDDLARLLLAINPAYQVTAIDASRSALRKRASEKFAFAVLHDTDGANVAADSRLLVFPPRQADAHVAPAMMVMGESSGAELQGRTNAPPLANPVWLGSTRIVALPGWMEPLAHGTAAPINAPIPLAGAGYTREGWIGVIAFDIRNHLLLDPDRLEALLLVISTIKDSAAADSPRVVSTGEFVTIPTFAAANLIAPSGAKTALTPDRWGRVQFRPNQAGRYLVVANRSAIEVFANYYNEQESDLAVPVSSQAASPAMTVPAPNAPSPSRIVPATTPLLILILLILMLESGLIARRSLRSERRHA